MHTVRTHKLGVMLDSFRLPFDKAVAMSADIGADALQLTAVGGSLNPISLSQAARRVAFDKIKSAGLSVSAICGDLGGHGFTRSQDNRRKIELSKRIVDMAADFETKVITTHIGVVPAEGGGCTEALALACSELGAYAASAGCVFAIETGPEAPEVLCRFLDGIGSAGLGVNYDPANLVMVTGVDPIAGVKVLAKHIVHTHAKDGRMLRQTDPKLIYDFFAEGGIEDMRMEDYFRELPLGEGDVDIPAWLSALDDFGYGGYITIEREVGASPAEDIRAAVAYLRSLAR